VTGPRAFPRPRFRDWLTATVVAVAVTSAALLQLFLGPDLGLADNGDGRRVLCGAGLQPPSTATAFTDVIFRVGPLTDPVAGFCDRPDLRYSTSQILLVDTAEHLQGLVSGPGLDLRVLGGLVAVLFGLSVGGLFLALPGATWVRLVVVAAATALLLDVSYVHYFASSFSESAGFLGLVTTAAALAWLARRPLGIAPLVLLLATTAVLVTAKSQLTPLAGLVVAAVVLRFLQHRRAAPGPHWRPALLVGAFIAALLVGSGLQLNYQGPDFHRANMHNLVLYTLAPLTDDPAAALEEMGFDPGMAPYTGTTAFNSPALDDPDYPAFIRSAGRAPVLRYLAGHPQIAATMLRSGLTEATRPRTRYLAEVAVADRAGQGPHADRYSPATDLLKVVRPAAWPLLPVLWTAMAAWGAVLAVRRTVRGVDMRAYGAPIAFTALAAGSQVVVSLLGDGRYELAKHEVFVSYLTWLALALTLGSLLRLLGGRSPAEQRVPHEQHDTHRGDASARDSDHGDTAPIHGLLDRKEMAT